MLGVVFDAVIELFCFFPSFSKSGFLFDLIVFILFVEVFVMVLTFFDDFVKMILFIFAGFLKFLSNFIFLAVNPFHKLFFDCVYSLFFFKLAGQFGSDMFLLLYFSEMLL